MSINHRKSCWYRRYRDAGLSAEQINALELPAYVPSIIVDGVKSALLFDLANGKPEDFIHDQLTGHNRAAFENKFPNAEIVFEDGKVVIDGV